MDEAPISPEHVAILQSGAAGALLSLLFQGKVTWGKALIIFTSGEICAYYGTQPLCDLTGWNSGVIGLTLGFAAMFVCGGAVNVLRRFQDDPLKFLRAIPFFHTFLGKGPQE